MWRAAVRTAKVLASIVGAAAAAVLLLLLLMWREHTTDVALPSPTGSFAVGRSQQAWTRTGGDELAIWLWYPAAADRDQQPADYLPAAWRQAMRDRQGTVMRTFFKRDPRVVRAHSRAAAALAADRRSYPVVLMRPGGSALTTDFTTLAENLASHGYIVVGFDAPGRSFVVVQADGRAIARAPGNNVENANGNLADPLVGRLLAMWIADTTFVVDRLQRLNEDASGPLSHRIDFDRLAMIGHSFGGATALQFCHVDPRCRSAVDLDGIPFGSVVTEGLAKPAMFVLSDHRREMSDPESHQVLAEIQSIFDRLPQPRAFLTMRTANHFSFSDQSLLNSQTALALLRLTGFPAVEARRGLAISNDCVRTFLDVTLNGASPDALKRLVDRYPELAQ